MPTATTWRFPRSFWTANGVELFERAAYYGTFISLALYLTRVVGFTDVQTGWIAGTFAAVLYFAPSFAGAIADSFGFRRSLILAFALLALGYLTLGAVPTKPSAILALTLIMAGGAFVKPVISGTVARSSDEVNRARAFSIFYQVVNIGSFSGKALAKPLRTEIGLESIHYASAGFALLALAVVLLLYREPAGQRTSRPPAEVLRGLVRVLGNVRFMALLVIVGGFWAIQQQLYATLPKYVLRVVGEGAAPEWYANVNPLVVVLLVIPITQAVRRLKPVTSIAVALGIIPVAALLMGLSPLLGESVRLGAIALHPVTVAMVAGIALQGLAECFLSPRFLEYTSKQAPPGETGLYMGYSYLTSFFGNILGFGLSGYLLERWCPDPASQPAAVQAAWQAAIDAGTPLPAAWAQAHLIWFVFAGVGAVAFVALLVFRVVTAALDRGR